jgi:hypothetical protein
MVTQGWSEQVHQGLGQSVLQHSLGWPGALYDLVYVLRPALPSDESSASRGSWGGLG